MPNITRNHAITYTNLKESSRIRNFLLHFKVARTYLYARWLFLNRVFRQE